MSGRMWFGLLFIFFGVGFLLHQFAVLDFYHVLSLGWPFIFIIIGLVQIFNFGYSKFVGLIFLLVGAALFLHRFFDFNTFYLWPVILIIVGIMLLFSRSSIIHRPEKHSEDRLDLFTLFSGAEVLAHSKAFKGGHITAIFGGAEVDLSEIHLEEDQAVLDISAVFGGVTLTVPKHLKVEVSGVPIFGGWENKVKPPLEEDGKVLKVNCLAAFGGVEVKN